MLGVMREIFSRDAGFVREEVDFFSVARTMPFVAGGQRIGLQSETKYDTLCQVGKGVGKVVEWGVVGGGGRREEPIPLMPREVTPWFTAAKAYSIQFSQVYNQPYASKPRQVKLDPSAGLKSHWLLALECSWPALNIRYLPRSQRA